MYIIDQHKVPDNNFEIVRGLAKIRVRDRNEEGVFELVFLTRNVNLFCNVSRENEFVFGTIREIGTLVLVPRKKSMKLWWALSVGIEKVRDIH